MTDHGSRGVSVTDSERALLAAHIRKEFLAAIDDLPKTDRQAADLAYLNAVKVERARLRADVEALEDAWTRGDNVAVAALIVTLREAVQENGG